MFRFAKFAIRFIYFGILRMLCIYLLFTSFRKNPAAKMMTQIVELK